MSNSIGTWYDFILQQMAAESYFQNVDWTASSDVIQAREKQLLMLGNNPEGYGETSFTRMTDSQAVDFLERYKIIDQLPNTASGFSATLIEKLDSSGNGTGEYTLSFRSTEYRQVADGGDFARDAQGADVDITINGGFAYGQLADMESYYAHLKLGERYDTTTQSWVHDAKLDDFANKFGGATPTENALNVTGYSLGGQLATVFTELHAAEINHTYLFNSLGRGSFDATKGDLQQMLADFERVLNDPEHNVLPGVDVQTIPGTGSNTLTGLWHDAVANESANIALPDFGRPADASISIYNDARYQYAVRWMQATYDTHYASSPGETGLSVDAASKIIQLYGHATHNDTENAANSGIHADNPIAIFIEDQPEVEGLFGTIPIGVPGWINQLLAGKGDFGNTHSLTLLADSLALMKVLDRLDPTHDKAQLGALLAAASNERAVSHAPLNTDHVAESNSLEKILDGLRTLILGTNTDTTASSKAGGFGSVGNRDTFYENLSALESALATNPSLTLQSLVSADQFAANGEPLAGATGYNAASIFSAAKDADGLAWRYAMQELNPFVVTGGNALYDHFNLNGELNLYDPATGQGLTDEWIADRAAMLSHKITLGILDARYDTTAGSQETNQGNTDITVSQYDSENILYQDLDTQFRIARSGDGDNVQHIIFGSQGNDASGLEGKSGDDHLYGLSGNDALTGNGGSDFLEGGQGNDRLNGDGETARISGAPGNDTLLGGAGIDILNGGAGTDTLDGGIDSDALYGGADADTYIYRSGDGADLLLDNADDGHGGDGLGQILFDGLALDGAYTRKDPDNRPGLFGNATWDIEFTGTPGERGILVITKAGDSGRIVISNFKSGELGITLDASTPVTPLPVNTDTGITATTPFYNQDHTIIDASSQGRLQTVAVGDYGEVRGNGKLIGNAGDNYLHNGEGDDELYGEAGRDVLVATGGNDQLHGGTEDDALQGGSGNDQLEGDQGNDILAGGLGEDVLNGGSGDDILLGSSSYEAISHNWSVTRNLAGDGILLDGFVGNADMTGDGADLLNGGAGNDYLMGGEGDDLLLGAEDNDWLEGDAGSDNLQGGVGNDILIGDSDTTPITAQGNDWLDGGDGNDTLYGYGKDDILIGGSGDDTLEGDAGTVAYVDHGNDWLDGGDGNDKLQGDGGADTLYGGAGNDQLFGDADDIATEYQGDDYLDGEAGDDYLRGYAGNDTLLGGDGTDQLLAGDGDDTLDGGTGNDLLFGEAGDDTLQGGTGDDSLAGGDGNDLITGGTGTDAMEGGAGNDTYSLNLGEGTRTAQGLYESITDTQGNNTIHFGDGITVANIRAAYDSTTGNLILSYGSGSDAVALVNGLTGNTVQTYQFVDGSTLTHAELMRLIPQTLDYSGSAGGNTIEGGAGDDTLKGGYGNDTLIGGAGNDTLAGNLGGDTYQIDLGSGHDTLTETSGASGTDTLQFGPGITPDQLRYTRQLNGDLTVDITVDITDSASGNTNDSLTLSGWFSTGRGIERFQFADGTVMEGAALYNLPIAAIQGTDNADLMTGTAGNDTLVGGAGGDTYLLGLNSGADTLVEAPGQTSTIEFAPGLTLDDANAWRRGNDLAVILDDGRDSLTVKDYYLAPQTITLRDVDGHTIAADALIQRTAADSLDNATAIRKAWNGYLQGVQGTILAQYPVEFETTAAGVISRVERTFHAGYTVSTHTDVWSDHALTTYATTVSFDGTHTYFGDYTVTLATPVVYTDSTWQEFTNGHDSHTTATLVQAAIQWDAPTNRIVPAVVGNDGYYSYGIIEQGTTTGTIINFITYGSGALQADPAHGIGVYTTNYVQTSEHYDIRQILGGAGDNTLIGGTLMDGGAGNDTLQNGALLYGNSGDDTLIGGTVMIGGAGNDTLTGGTGANRYFYTRTDNGSDTISDSGDDTYAYFNWHFTRQGIANWQERLEHGGQYALVRDGYNDYGDTLDALLNPYGEWSPEQLQQQISQLQQEGNVYFVEALAYPDTTAHDYPALAAFYAANPNLADSIEFAPGVTANDLSFSWTTAANDQAVLQASWNGDSSIDIAIPRAWHAIGSGIELFKFADGTMLTMAQIIAIAPQHPDFLDIQHGTAGNDVLDGHAGQDVIDGGAGDDLLQGWAGNDVYLFGNGYGHDTILEDDSSLVNTDTVRMADDILPADVRVAREANGDLSLTLNAGVDRLTLSNWLFGNGHNRVEQVVFADGTVWNASTLLELSGTGTPGDDTLSGFDLGETLNALGGNDNLYGLAGNDTLIGGTGNDVLDGGIGNDTYVFNLGDGIDVIIDTAGPDGGNTLVFGAGITPADISLGLGSLLIRVGSNGDAVHLANFDPSDALGPHAIDTFRFADGTTLNYEQLLAFGINIDGTANDEILYGTNVQDHVHGLDGNDMLFGMGGDDTLDGGTGDDYLDGWEGNDTLDGGAGNDGLYGGAGSDTYVFGPGSGQDEIYDDKAMIGEVNTVRIASEILPSDVTVTRDDYNLYLALGDGTDQLTLSNWFLGDEFKAEQVVFADGTVWDAATLEALAIPPNSAPELINPIPGQLGVENHDFTFQIPADTFADPDVGDVLSYSATLADGSALPDWLSLDAATGVFSGTPGLSDAGMLSFIVTATDQGGLTASGSFDLDIANLIQGTQYSDTLNGTAGNDYIDAGAGNDTVNGGDGNDIIIGGAGSDVLAGGTGDDTFLVEGNDSGYDRFEGDDGYDVIQGGEGDDVIRLNSFSGIYTVERIDGGAGLNIVSGTQYSDTVDLSGTELVNIAFITGTTGNDTMIGSAGDDVIIGDLGSDVLAGGMGNDTFLVNGSDSGYDRFEGDDGYDVIQGGEGDDVIRVNNFSGIYTVEMIDGGAGTNTVAGTQYSDSINLSATELVNIATIDGGLGNDTITGSVGDDVIDGGTGSDVLAGGTGNDTFLINGSDSSYDRFEGDDGYDTIQGGSGDDVIRVNNFSGIYTVEKIDGGAGINTIAGTQYSDSINLAATELVNIASIDGGLGNDTITGSAGDDVIIGGTGSDVLAGGAGNDTFLIDSSDAGYDRFEGDAGFDAIQGGAADDVIRVSNFSGIYTVEKIDGGAGSNVIAGTQYSDTIDLSGTTLVNITDIDAGAGNDTITGSAGDDVIIGGTGSDVLAGGAGNDTFLIDGSDANYDRFEGDAGFDVIQGGAADDVIRVSNFSGVYTVEKIDGGAGSNVIAGTQYSDTIDLSATQLVNIGLLDGGAGNDTLTGSAGNDLIRGGDGADRLTDSSGHNLLDGGIGNDVLIGGSGNELLLGGTGNDTLTTGTGYDVIAFNTGDGQDTVNASTGADNTLSLGGGIKYADLTLSKSGNNLVLKTGGTDQIILSNWYASTANHSVLNLQVLAEAMADFAPGGSDVLKDNKVETFNFAGLVGAFDTALAANPTLTSWALTNALMDFHLGSGSDTDAIGGDLAYQYGKTGTLAGIGLNTAQSVISAPQFGQSAQTLNAPSTWQAEIVKLG